MKPGEFFEVYIMFGQSLKPNEIPPFGELSTVFVKKKIANKKQLKSAVRSRRYNI